MEVVAVVVLGQGFAVIGEEPRVDPGHHELWWRE